MDDLAILAALGAYLVVVLIVGIVYYVVSALAHMKALNALGYEKAWLAWIPFANYYAYADAASDGRDNVNLFGSIEVPGIVYKFWWVIWMILFFIPFLGATLAFLVRLVFLGNCYVKMYARLENRPEQDQQVLGYLSGWISIIAVVKFLTGKYK